jgi:hypothetical protein
MVEPNADDEADFQELVLQCENIALLEKGKRDVDVSVAIKNGEVKGLHLELNDGMPLKARIRVEPEKHAAYNATWAVCELTAKVFVLDVDKDQVVCKDPGKHQHQREERDQPKEKDQYKGKDQAKGKHQGKNNNKKK